MATPEAYARGDETRTVDGGSIRHYPRFEATYSFDDRRYPSKVTIFEHGENIATSWITVDIGHAVPVEEIA